MADWGYDDDMQPAPLQSAVPQPTNTMDSQLRQRLMSPQAAPQNIQMPQAPKLGNVDPRLMTDAYRNTSFDVYRDRGPGWPDDQRVAIDREATIQNQLAQHQMAQDLVTQMQYEAKTGFTNPKAEKAARWGNFAQGVFDNFLAPVAGAFGGPGASAGVNSYLSQANEAAKLRQKQVDSNRHQAVQGLKSAMDMMGRSSRFTQQNFNNFMAMSKAEAMIQREMAAAQAAIQQANSSQQQAFKHGVDAQSRQNQDTMGYMQMESKLATDEALKRQRESTQKLRDAQATTESEKQKTQGARRSLMGRQGALAAERQNTEITKQGANNALKTKRLQESVGKPIKDRSAFIKGIPARYAKNVEGAEALVSKLMQEKGWDEGTARAKVLADLRGNAWETSRKEKGNYKELRSNREENEDIEDEDDDE